jgi:hypothetical protein
MRRTATTHLRILLTLCLLAAATLLALGRAGPAAAARPIDMADMFLVDQDGGWFCEDLDANPNTGTTCHGKPEHAAHELLRRLKGRHPNLYLRVAKARDDCDVGQSHCTTGVPKHRPCAKHPDSPWCALDRLRDRGIKLGVIVGAETDAGKPRSAADLALQACRISQADTTRLYAWLFIDLTNGLTPTGLTAAIHKIRAGKTGSGKPCPGVSGQRKRWSKIVTNDNHTWDPAHPASLDTGAWGHAKRLAILGDTEIGGAAADPDGLTDEDAQFVQQVNALGHGRAVLRLEVPTQTSRFAGLPRADQCALLTRWASQQRERDFTLIYPLYVHGVDGAQPYDSFGQRTFGLQSRLIDRYPSRKSTAGLPDCQPDGGSTAGKLDEPSDDEPEGQPVDEPPAKAPAPPPAVRLAGVGAQEPTERTCHSARLHGWVNPHGNATRFHFEVWEHGVNVAQPAGGGDAGAGTERNDVSRVADGLRPDTHYAARLIAVNAAGQSSSDVVSFQTRQRC